ncbi:MAG TPA: SDR family oxidoreductase [Terracidiphilus sp.]|nr:SDR family oxidoreductase [Terracidiphilus sp.]
MANRPLDGKVVLVTGGARRLGRQIAITLAEAGADVSITYRNSKAEAAQTADALAALGAGALAIECDVRSEDQVRAAVMAVAGSFGRLDVLVNNAAVFATEPLESLSVEAWDAVFAANTRGPFLVAREALPHLRATGGRIVNIGSLGGLRAWATHAHYCASKAALHSLTQAMAKAFAPEVSVNCVAPGWVDMESEAREDALTSAARFAARTPMKRNGSAADVAQAVLFFAAGPHFITGQILGVDGGLSLS